MFLNYEQIKEITVGAVYTENTDEGMRFYKLSPSVRAKLEDISENFGIAARCSTGIRLDFHTNSKHLNLELESPAKFEVYVNGLLRRFIKDETTLSMDIDVAYGCSLDDARITIYFPAHKRGKLKSLELDDGAYVKPHKFDRSILFMGDSITQGWDTQFDSLSFANKVSRHFNADSVVQGVGGACFFPEYLEKLQKNFDWVVVAYGTNDFDKRKEFDVFYSYMSEYMSKLSELYGDKKVFVISPIWRRISKPEAQERFEIYRKAIAAEAEKYGFVHVDGALLVPPVAELYTDGLHPNDIGFSIYAENLIRIMENS